MVNMHSYRRVVRWSLCFIIAFVIAMLAYGLVMTLRVKVHHTAADLFFYMLFCGEDNTRFAAGYNDAKFLRIRPGMSKAEVISLLGEPLRKDMIDGRNYVEVWRYTDAPQKSNYWFRVIRFDKDEKVADSEAKYFVG